MNTIVEQMIQIYNAQTVYDQKNAMKEVMQEIVLCELSLQFKHSISIPESKYQGAFVEVLSGG